MKKILLILLFLFISLSCDLDSNTISNAEFPVKVISLSTNPFGESTYTVRDNKGKVFYIFTGKAKPHKIGDIIE